MQLPKVFWNYFSFFSAAITSVLVATVAIDLIEKTSRDQVKKELLTGGATWADVETVGLQVFLIGNAPDEASRFNAISLAGNVVDAERVIDQMNIIDNQTVKPPGLKLEILKNGSDISVYGIVPKKFNKSALIDSLKEKGKTSRAVRDFIEYSSIDACLLYTSPSPRDRTRSRMPSSA